MTGKPGSENKPVPPPPPATPHLPQGPYPATAPAHSTVSTATGRRPRSGFRSFAQPQQALTVPIRGIARVAQRQLAQIAQSHYQQRVQQKEETREILGFALRLAETMFHYGADASDVDTAVVSVCAVYGIHDVEVDITYQSIMINYVSEFDEAASRGQLPEAGEVGTEKLGHTLVRVVRSTSENYRALEQLYQLLADIGTGQVSRTRAERRLAAINADKKPYSPAVLLLWNLLMAVAFTFGVGGSWRAAVVALAVFTAVNGAMSWAGRLALPSFFMMGLGSAVVTILALLVSSPDGWLYGHGFYVSAPHIVAAGLMMLLPTFRLVSAVQDALHGYPLTAAGKFVITGVNFVGLVAGIAVAVTLMSYFDAASLDVQRAVFNPPPLWVSIAGMAWGSAMSTAAWQGSARNIGLTVAVSLVGQLVYYGVGATLGAEAARLQVLVGAFAVGLSAAVLGYMKNAPASIYYVPGMMFMLPGLSIFRSSYLLLSGEDISAGVQGLTMASMTVLLMATGIVCGTYLCDYVTEKIRSRGRPASGS